MMDERRRAAIKAILAPDGGGIAVDRLARLLSEKTPQLPWNQGRSPDEDLLEVASDLGAKARAELAEALLAVACGEIMGTATSAEQHRAFVGACFAIVGLDVPVDPEPLKRIGVGATDEKLAFHALRVAARQEERNPSRDTPDPFWFAMLSHQKRAIRSLAAQHVVRHATTEGLPGALALCLMADDVKIGLVAHEWAKRVGSDTHNRRDAWRALPRELRDRLEAGLVESGHGSPMGETGP